MDNKVYDVIVVGGGHAGCEAAAASANIGMDTLLISMNLQNLGQMSCNPAMGGIAKGQILREIDAMGGVSGIISDKSAVQFKMLNRSKGPAMWSPRTQNDRFLFSYEWRMALEAIDKVHFYQDMVVGLKWEGTRITGVNTGMGLNFNARAVILTSGTFLNGLIHIGEKNFGGGRMGEKASHGITEVLEDLGFSSGRMKTGTPPRVDGRSLDYSKMTVQPGDPGGGTFSYLQEFQIKRQLDCWLTHTSEEVHELLEQGFERSPMFNGRIQSIGPRYCPSIEDKIHRFKDKNSHQIFVEPEGWQTVEVYVNGFSTSLPEDIQYKALKKVKGFEHVRFFRPGYAIEYDYFPPQQLNASLETKVLQGLFFAGQINGTTGYEEAAAQGLMAGINAARYVQETEPVVLKRNEAYIGVLIDDLVTKGTEEPYRMFTSRAEYRTLLRQDNADYRLTEKSYGIGLAREDRLNRMKERWAKIDDFTGFLSKTSFDLPTANEILDEIQSKRVTQTDKYTKLFLRPGVDVNQLLRFDAVKDYAEEQGLDDNILETAEIEVKYAGYIEKEKALADKINRLENVRIPRDMEFSSIRSLSMEARQKLSEVQPETIAQASRISGVNPSDVSVLLVHLGR